MEVQRCSRCRGRLDDEEGSGLRASAGQVGAACDAMGRGMSKCVHGRRGTPGAASG